MAIPSDPVLLPARGGRVAVIQGWHSRYDNHPHILRVAREAEYSSEHERLYRGDRGLKTEHLFLMGAKARPLHHDGDVARLDRGSAELLSENEQSFSRLCESYLDTGMARQRLAMAPGLEAMVEAWRGAEAPERYLMALAILAALQFQNSRRAAADWREYLWFLSCSRSDTIALKYALGGRRGNMPNETYVVEYAPQCGLVLPVAHFADLIDRFRLGRAFPDLDDEVFAQNALLPHYILGYSKLTRAVGAENTYDTEFVPHNYYARPDSSIRQPPDLNEAQERIFAETRDTLAWVESRGGEWRRVYDPRGPRRLGPGDDPR